MGDKLESPQDPVASCRETLGRYSRHSSPEAWAVAQNNLGVALLELAKGSEGTDLVEDAIAAFRQAMRVWTPETSRRDWEITQNNLAEALVELGMREKRPRISIAILKEGVLACDALREPKSCLERAVAWLRSCRRRFTVMLRLRLERPMSRLRRCPVGRSGR